MSYPIIKRTKSSEESIPTKRKHSDGISSSQRNGILLKSISHDESTKRLKSDIFFTVNTKDKYEKFFIILF